MYKCDDCGCVFDEPGTYWETVCNISEYDTAERECPCCPRCHSYQYDEVWECKICGEYYHEGETYCESGNKCYCEDCVIEAMTSDYDLFKQFLKLNKLEKDFYIGFVFDSNPEGTSFELLYLTQTVFESNLKLDRAKEKCKKIIAEYLKAGDDLMVLAAEIIEGN